jgi:hypothetical protein
MRRVLELLGDEWEKNYVGGSKKCRFYSRNGTVVLGSYENACGGCDGIGSARIVYDEIQSHLADPSVRDILCEGLLLSEDVKWSSQLGGLRIIFLTTPVEQCIEQIKRRRQEAGNDKPLNEENTRRRVAVIERARTRLELEGVTCRRASAEQAPRIILKWLEE